MGSIAVGDLALKVAFETLPSWQKVRSNFCISPQPIRLESETAFCIGDIWKGGEVDADRTLLLNEVAKQFDDMLLLDNR